MNMLQEASFAIKKKLLKLSQRFHSGIVDLGWRYFENMALTDSVGTKGDVDELDIMPKYTFELPKDLSLVFGFAQYTFPNTEFENTVEIFGKLVHSLFNFTYWYDVDEVGSWYTSASVTPNITFQEVITVGLLGTIGYGGSGYNEFYFNTEQVAINDTVVGAYFSVTEGSFVTTLSINRYMLLSDEISTGAEELYGKSDSTLVSMSLAWLF